MKSKKWRRRELGPFVTTGADFSFCIYWGDFSGAKGVARECTGCKRRSQGVHWVHVHPWRERKNGLNLEGKLYVHESEKSNF